MVNAMTEDGFYAIRGYCEWGYGPYMSAREALNAARIDNDGCEERVRVKEVREGTTVTQAFPAESIG